jgi:hypothetical protein
LANGCSNETNTKSDETLFNEIWEKIEFLSVKIQLKKGIGKEKE